MLKNLVTIVLYVSYLKLQSWVSFVSSNNILSDAQYGFHSNRSTCLALTELVETIADAIDSSKYRVDIFIDLKKVFDTLDHDVLVSPLNHYAIRGIA